MCVDFDRFEIEKSQDYYKFQSSLRKDQDILKVIKSNLKNYQVENFKFKVDLPRSKYIQMIKGRYISCLLNMTDKELKKGVNEIKSIYKNRIKFTDTLNCINYKK